MSGVGLPMLFVPSYSDHPSDVPEPPQQTKWHYLDEKVPSKMSWRFLPKMIGAYDIHCKGIMDNYKSCAKGFMYDPESVLKCLYEFSEMRSCLTSVNNHMLTKCEDTMDAVIKSYEGNTLTEQVADSMADCIRSQVIQQDLSDIKLQHTSSYMKHVEQQAKARKGLFVSYQG